MSWIDLTLLNLTERSCQAFQRLTGRTNVWVAFQLTNLSIVVYFVWAAVYVWVTRGVTRILLALFSTALMWALTQTIFRASLEVLEESAYRRVAKGLRNPRDLSKATLIVVAHLRTQWAWWFEAAGLPAPIQPAGEVVFESSPMAIKAVLDGVGVAVAQLPYVSDALAAGRLVSPFAIVPRRYEGWYLIYRPARKDDRALVAFRDWLHGEAALQQQEYERLIASSKRTPK